MYTTITLQNNEYEYERKMDKKERSFLGFSVSKIMNEIFSVKIYIAFIV
jgi:hypothetical protein